ncbi:alginate lyase family protein [Oleiharenicola lentus]|uniref:alginate lyase family protein n=1 Tax=Oleiharenicola lentus TaxID=2508720 RepID=UPI003F67A32F
MIRSSFAKSCALALVLILSVRSQAGETFLLKAQEIETLAAESPKALKAKIVTVADKSVKSPSGDQHDYVSFARYYWPDPKKPDGMPYVSRDGQHNHEQVAKGDRYRIGNFCDTLAALAAAWRVHHDEAAARRAGEWLRAWLVTPATRMNPHLDYAQVRLGHNENRGNPAGVLDSRDLAKVIDSLILLEDSPALTVDDKSAIRAWFSKFLHWLETAPNALAERTAKNNHGAWYFAQAIPIARYVGRDDLARQLIEEDKALIAHQIKADGSQPEEIRRVDGLGYSRFNLEAHATVARVAAGLGADLWSYTAPNGANLRNAVTFLQPYNAHPEKWPHSQNEKLRAGFLDDLIQEAAPREAESKAR